MKYGHALFEEEIVIRKKNTVDHFIGHIPFASLEDDKRPDKINQKSSLKILCPKQENNVSIFRVPPLIKNHLFICCELGGSPTYLRMTNF